MDLKVLDTINKVEAPQMIWPHIIRKIEARKALILPVRVGLMMTLFFGLVILINLKVVITNTNKNKAQNLAQTFELNNNINLYP